MILWCVAFCFLGLAILSATASERFRLLSRARLFESIDDDSPRAEEAEYLTNESMLLQQVAMVSSAVWLELAGGCLIAIIPQLNLPETWSWFGVFVIPVLLLAIWICMPWLCLGWFKEARLLAWWPILNHLFFPGWILVRLTKRFQDQRTSQSHESKATEAEENLEEEIRSMVTAGQREGLIENDEREMIESVMDLADATIAQIMTPRIEMVSLQVDTGWEELIRFTSESGHSRIPVHGKSRDEIVGILHIKDVLSELARGQRARRPLRSLLRRPFFVPETKPVNEMLQEFQRGRTHIAIVLDEYAGVSGLVTIEDVLEEIVGEIADEHDEGLVDGIKQIDETTYEAHGRVHLSECNQRLEINLPEDENFDTLAGYVFHELGRIPVVGETLERAGVRIKIVDSNRRRIDRLLIEKLTPSEPTAELNSNSTTEQE